MVDPWVPSNLLRSPLAKKSTRPEVCLKSLKNGLGRPADRGLGRIKLRARKISLGDSVAPVRNRNNKEHPRAILIVGAGLNCNSCSRAPERVYENMQNTRITGKLRKPRGASASLSAVANFQCSSTSPNLTTSSPHLIQTKTSASNSHIPHTRVPIHPYQPSSR